MKEIDSDVGLACNYLSCIASSRNYKKAYSIKYFTARQKSLAFSAMKAMLRTYGEERYSAMSFQELAGESESYLQENYAMHLCFDGIGISGFNL